MLKELKELTGNQANLKIYGHFLYNPYAIIMGDEVLYITLYFTSRGRRDVPVLAFERREGGFFGKVREDVDNLIFDAEEITNYTVAP